jgi:hypothetical protein
MQREYPRLCATPLEAQVDLLLQAEKGGAGSLLPLPAAAAAAAAAETLAALHMLQWLSAARRISPPPPLLLGLQLAGLQRPGDAWG